MRPRDTDSSIFAASKGEGREVRRICENCDFYDSSTQARDAQPDTTGLCRKGRPRANKFTGMAVWPFVEDTDWCGEFWISADADLPATDDENVSGAVK